MVATPESERTSPMPDKDEWRTLQIPLNLYDRLHVQLGRIMLANGQAPEHLSSEEKRVRTAARVDAIEFLVLLCERTEDNKVFRI
jgi:hypothetical protein